MAASLGELDWLGPAEFVFQTPVRAKKHRPDDGEPDAKRRRRTLARIGRIAHQRPEVMVKVSGSARGRKNLRDHLAYITRNGQLVAERENGEQIRGTDAVREMAAEWWALRGEGRANTRDTFNLVLSMPSGTDGAGVLAAARAFAQAEFGGQHDYLAVLHTLETDPYEKKRSPNPHVHLTVKAVGFDGQRLNPRKADLQTWREAFAEHLRGQGIEAEATSRRTRGQVRKSKRQVIHHLDLRQASRVSRWKIKQAIRTVRSGEGEGRDVAPWQGALEQRQAKIRHAWGQIAQVLEGQGEVALAVQVQQFIQTLPAIRSERDELLQRARVVLDSIQDRGRRR